MFCTNCGKKIDSNMEFCTNCGTRIKRENNVNTNENNFSDVLAKKNPIPLLLNKIKEFFTKYKKQVSITVLTILIITGILISFNFTIGFERLKWNKDYKDYKLDYVTQSKIKLGVKFSDNKKLNKLKVTTTCGKSKSNGSELEWDLTEALGKCKIEVKYKLKKISKTVDVINNFVDKSNLNLDFKVDYDSDEDLDLDGLTNKQEKEYGTNPELYDTDMDGLDDKYELFTSKTDPLKKDTDGDGLNDFDEIKLGLDPLKPDSKGDGIKDGKRTLTYDYTTKNLKLSITGTGNIASTVADVNSNTKISNKTGLIDKLYTFYTDGTMEKAIVTISYTDEELTKYKLNEDNLTIYYYNEKKSEYEKINTTVDKKNNTLTATLEHFSSYVVGDSSFMEKLMSKQLLFILDNSWSMYTNEQYKNLTGNETQDLEGFDADGLRFTLTSNLINRLSNKSFRIGLSEFRSDYSNILKIGSSADELTAKLKTMNGNFSTFFAGTNIGNALSDGIDEFSDDVLDRSDYKYIVILTDGQDSNLRTKTGTIIEKAIEKKVKICSIGFGGGSYNTELSNISNGTGCKFYSSGNADGLRELFEDIGTEFDYSVDTDDDGKTDSLLIADSGFIVNKDGFSFSNYGSNLSEGGHCYGMATFAQLYYSRKLPLTFNSKTVKKLSGEATSYKYDLTNTYFKDYSNLYGYKLQTNALKYKFGYGIFGEEEPSDLRTLENKKISFTEKYKKEINAAGIYDIEEKETTLSKEEQIKRSGVYYDTYDDLYLNEDKMQTSKIIKNDDLQMFNAIYASFIKQFNTVNYSSGTSFMLWLRKTIGTEKTYEGNQQGFLNILKTRLNNNDAPVIIVNGGLHAINAISLAQDIDNPNYYHIGVYDNNYPGEKRYVDIKCNDKTCVTVANKYYGKSNEPIRISLSLEADLEYFK